jgi:hypothetical protein
MCSIAGGILPNKQNMKYAPLLASLFTLAVQHSAFAIPTITNVDSLSIPLQIRLPTVPPRTDTFTYEGTTVTGGFGNGADGLGVNHLADVTFDDSITGMLFSDLDYGGGVLNIFYGNRGSLNEITFDQGNFADYNRSRDFFDINFNEPVKRLQIQGFTSILGFTRSVPDSGSTLMLLGLGLVGTVFYGRIVRRGKNPEITVAR